MRARMRALILKPDSKGLIAIYDKFVTTFRIQKIFARGRVRTHEKRRKFDTQMAISRLILDHMKCTKCQNFSSKILYNIVYEHKAPKSTRNDLFAKNRNFEFLKISVLTP